MKEPTGKENSESILASKNLPRRQRRSVPAVVVNFLRCGVDSVYKNRHGVSDLLIVRVFQRLA
jgi:hypothetical protein